MKKGATQSHDGEKRQNIFNDSIDMLCSNNFNTLLSTIGKDGNIMTPTLYLIPE